MLNFELTEWETEGHREGYDPELKAGEFKIAPAKWIWLPSERTLPCTFVLFRKEFVLESIPNFARGWIAADSRYVLYVNGSRVQFGPAPHDPRHAEADPVNIRQYLRTGKNVIAIHVMFYGQGDGTWPTGKPGLMFRVTAGKEIIATDKTWLCSVDRGHKPGGAKRWFLRALQEDFISTNFSHGWNNVNFETDLYWYKAMELEVASTSTPFVGKYNSYNEDIQAENPKNSTLTARSIPMMHESWVETRLKFHHLVKWSGNVNDWFDFRTPGLAEYSHCPAGEGLDSGCHLLTYELPFGMVGWPSVHLDDAKAGYMEVICQESRDPTHELLDSQFYSWSRFHLSDKQRVYECFDYECCKYIQLHIELPDGITSRTPVVRFRRRTIVHEHQEHVETSSTELNRVLLASTITLQNSAQDIVVDGMARERQQYAGDCAHQLHAVRQAHGEFSVSKRFLSQFAHGQMLNGVWLDSWPGHDRLARIGQRQIGATSWGSLVDHSIGFVIENVNHWLQTGDRTPYEQNRQRIQKFVDYLSSITGLDGLLKVENIGSETIWIDHDAYHSQSHKKLAFNLYAMQMNVMLDWIEGRESNLEFQVEAIRRQFWHEKIGALIANRDEIGTRQARYCDRSIAHILWLHAHGIELVPDLSKAIDVITKQPKSMGISYPANSVWRHWAWARLGRVDLIINELETRWASMYSVKKNSTIQEMWESTPGTTSLMSHCAVSPTIMMHQAILGIGQDKFGNWFIRPQIGDLEKVSVISHTPWGKVGIVAERLDDLIHCSISKPDNMPLSLRTFGPLNMPFHDLGNEFSHDLTLLPEIKFVLAPYPQNKLIAEH